jgi:hypothetical protein
VHLKEDDSAATADGPAGGRQRSPGRRNARGAAARRSKPGWVSAVESLDAHAPAAAGPDALSAAPLRSRAHRHCSLRCAAGCRLRPQARARRTLCASAASSSSLTGPTPPGAAHGGAGAATLDPAAAVSALEALGRSPASVSPDFAAAMAQGRVSSELLQRYVELEGKLVIGWLMHFSGGHRAGSSAAAMGVCGGGDLRAGRRGQGRARGAGNGQHEQPLARGGRAALTKPRPRCCRLGPPACRLQGALSGGPLVSGQAGH